MATTRRAWPTVIGIAVAASLVAMLLQLGIRVTWQVRSLPERVMEWLLLFVPLDLFEGALQRFGANAKDLALIGTFAGMSILLLLAAIVALRKGASGWVMLLLGVAFWLFAMLVVMPVTGAGLFAGQLLVSPVLTDAAYVCVFAGYSAVLALGASLVRPVRTTAYQHHLPANPDRRDVLAGLGGVVGMLVAFGVARTAATTDGSLRSTLPLASVPTAPPAASPTTARPQTSAPVAASTPNSVTPVLSTPTTTAATNSFPTPAPARSLSRDQEGSLVAAGRPPGSLAPTITSNQDFYIVTKNAVADPVLDANTWRLIIDGEVNHPVQVDYATLRGLPPVDITKTLECISNLTAGCSMASFGCDLISTAVWRGARLSDVLDLAGGLKSSAVDVAFLGSDEFSSALPPDAVLDPDTLLAYEMNGEILPREHGFPVRVLVPGRYGMKNPKWLAGIRAVDQPYQDWYQQRGWSKDGIIKTMSRIDVPADGARLSAGAQRAAGIAYAGDRGIQQVELSTDDGTTWQTADLLEPASGKDTMVRWSIQFDMADAPLNLVVRATDGTGTVQPDDFGLPAPDGGWGQDSIQVQPV